MYEILTAIAPIFICVGIGLCWHRAGKPYPSDFITRMVMNIGAPCLIISVLGNASVDAGQFLMVARAALLIFLTSLVVHGVLLRLFGVPLDSSLPALLFGNNGNMGLPLCLFAFGDAGLALGLGYFVVLVIMNFTLGIGILTWGGSGGHSRYEVFRQPLFYSALIGLGLMLADHDLPRWLQSSVDLLAGLTIPLMLITLGVSLARLEAGDVKGGLVFSLLRVGGGVLCGFLVAEALALEGIVRGVVIVQSAMPAAVSNYLLALKYTDRAGRVAGTVVLSTILSLATLPYLMAFALQQAGR